MDESEFAQKICSGLHELCQPLTALQFRLELGRMEDTPAGKMEAITEALEQCERLYRSVRVLQLTVHERMTDMRAR